MSDNRDEEQAECPEVLEGTRKTGSSRSNEI